MEIYLYVMIVIVVMMIGVVFIKNNNVDVMICSKKITTFNHINLYENICFAIVMSALLLIAIFRNESVGTDYRTYLGMFRALLNMDISDISGYYLLESGEFAIPILGGIAQFFFTDEYILSAFMYSVLMGGFFFFIKHYSKDVLLSSYLFLTMSFYNMSLNILRQYLAAVIVLKALEYISNNWKRFILLIFIAIGFHKTAIMILLIYITIKFTWDIRISCIVALLFSVLFALLGSELIPFIAQSSGYETYIASAEDGSIDIKILVSGVLFVIYFISATKFIQKDDNAKIWILGSAVAFGLSIFAINMHAINRLLLYFMLLEIVSIPNYLTTIESYNMRLLLKCGLVILAGVYYYILVTNTSCYETVPYELRAIL